jgi:cytoskeleton protein RodZ
MTASHHDDNQRTSDDQPMTAAPEPVMTDTAGFDASGDSRELFAMPATIVEEDVADASSLGRRLRAIRESRELSVDEVATRLRLPQRVINTIESGDFSRIEHDVYLRGYLVSYARLLGVPGAEVEHHLRERVPAPPVLIATRRVSHSRYLFERYSVPAVYVILTGLIVAPAVWLASHGGLEQNLARLAPLDAPADTRAAPEGDTSATPPSAPVSGNSSPADTTVSTTRSALPAPSSEPPLMASLAPFPPMTTAESTSPPVVATTPLPRGTYEVVLTLNEASWVEILAKNGERIEYKLLPAGSRREYSVDQPVTVRLGNATGASVRVNGEAVDIAPHRRANVARFQLSSGGASPPPPES